MNIIKKWLEKLDKNMEEKSKESCDCCSGECRPKKKASKKK